MSHPCSIAREQPERVAFVLGEEALTYGELAARAERLAGRLAALGCARGDTVALILGNGAEFFVAAWPAQTSGLYFVPMSERLAPPERDHILADSGAKVVLARDAGLANVLTPGEWEEGPVAGFEVFFEGPRAHAYHGDPAKARAATSRQGYATMGDIGHVDADGFLHLTDRAAFTIILGGANIYPAEVEAALMADPQIVDCAVFGVPDADMGEVVQAIVEAAGGPPADPAARAAAIGERLAGLIAPNKIPRQIAFVGRVPRLETGKVRKQELRDFHADPARRGHPARTKPANPGRNRGE
ncbi:class I adenylate-forming enzyme family protein [Erythrobacter sp. HL-111]|uniref:class I adenylate-forming enzyme family protein n=1 Tax=Erythrobacter sp. HL-111 TaxID=1798193 RepID=UPI00087C8240|nr:AMP-binding protein [Erythrobacter sp. HL-111]SDS94722.1 AMP-binding enzyme C-terminal domain-containing protein [Erythrobacter sp. HL-111]